MVPVGTLVQSFSAPRHHFGGAGSDRPSGWPALAGGRSFAPVGSVGVWPRTNALQFQNLNGPAQTDAFVISVCLQTWEFKSPPAWIFRCTARLGPREPV